MNEEAITTSGQVKLGEDEGYASTAINVILEAGQGRAEGIGKSPRIVECACEVKSSEVMDGEFRATRQGKARQGKARQGKARQGKARQGKARHWEWMSVSDLYCAIKIKGRGGSWHMSSWRICQIPHKNDNEILLVPRVCGKRTE